MMERRPIGESQTDCEYIDFIGDIAALYFSGAKAGFVFYAVCDRMADLLHCKSACRIS